MKKLFIDYFKILVLFFILLLLFGSGDVRRAAFYSLVAAVIYLVFDRVVLKLFKKGDNL